MSFSILAGIAILISMLACWLQALTQSATVLWTWCSIWVYHVHILQVHFNILQARFLESKYKFCSLWKLLGENVLLNWLKGYHIVFVTVILQPAGNTVEIGFLHFYIAL